MIGRREPEHVRISKSLGVAIVTGRYPPESILPGEIELAQQYAVSRSVVREALRMLAAKGLLTSKPRAGTRVRARIDWNLLDPELLAWMFEGEPPAHYVRSLFQLRMIVEPAAAELAAVARSARHLSRMGHMLELMAKHGLADAEGQRADEKFHSIILDATGNELLLSLAGSIAAAVRWTTFFKYRATRHLRDSLPLHRSLFEAIAESDPVAAREATVHLISEAKDDTEAALLRIR